MFHSCVEGVGDERRIDQLNQRVHLFEKFCLVTLEQKKIKILNIYIDLYIQGYKGGLAN